METQRNIQMEPTVTYRQVTEIQPGPEFENTSTSGRTSETRGTLSDCTTQPSVTYRQVADIQPGAGFDKTRTNSTQSAQYDYIDHIDAGLAAGTNRINRDATIANNGPSENPPSTEYEDTGSGMQHEYNYIDDRLNVPIANEIGRIPGVQNAGNASSGKVCDCFKKYKITIAVLVSVLLTTIIVGMAMALLLPVKSDRPKDTSENGSQQTTAGPLSEQTTSDTGSNIIGQAFLVIIGGQTFEAPSELDTVQIYSVKDGHVTWIREGNHAPYCWYNGGAAASGGNIYIAGGWILDQANNQDEESLTTRAAKYNVRDDSWVFLPNKTIPAGSGPAMYVIKNQLYAADGEGTFISKFITPSDTQTDKLDLSIVDSGWTNEQASPTHDVAYVQAAVIGDRAYICAGPSRSSEIKTVISWTYGELAWTPAADMNVARSRHHGTVTDGHSNIWVIGGCDPDDCWPDGFIEQYSVTNNTWTKLNQVPYIERDFYSVLVCGYWQEFIYVIFSRLSGISRRYFIPKFHVFNTQTREWHLDSTELMLPVYGSMYAIVP